MSHSYMPADQKERSGITPGLVRMSVGIETLGDLLEDVDRALDLACSGRAAPRDRRG
jgi:cystathionine beta-lyase/cystathionine gamma-synthase